MKQKRVTFIVFIILLTLFISVGLYLFLSYNINIDSIVINVDKYLNDNNLYNINVLYKENKEMSCSLDNKNWYTLDKCHFEVQEGSYKLYLKNKYFSSNKDFEVIKQISGTFTSSLDKLDIYYLALNGYKKIDFIFNYESDFPKTIKWYIEDKNILSINDNTIYGKSVGTTTITATLKDGNSKTYNVMVTDLINPHTLDNNKSYLPCKNYTEEENVLLDKILESRVIEAGVGTRGGVLAAARFLTLEFPYTIRYFNENGRLVDHGWRPHIDGEGRYYHKGLYLSEAKYDELEKGASTKSGPKMWGCKIYDRFVKRYNMNGFTCSGFVTWAMLNGGFDVGDVGAGNYKQFNDDLSDLGEHKKITKEYMKNGNYKVGDFIARNGHAALIIGIDKDYIYTAESLPPKLKVYKYGRYEGIVRDTNLTYIIEMSDIYPNGDGIYTNMWY